MTQYKMTEDQQHTKKEYEERHRFWADKTLAQFGFANNFFLIVAIGILGFILREIETDKQIFLSLFDVNWKITLSRISAILAFISVCCGSITMLARLFDLRLTRHINTIRIKAFCEKFSYKKIDIDYIFVDNQPLIPNFIETIFSTHYYINYSEISNDETLKYKFKDVTRRALILGRISWKYFYYQLVILILSVLTFMTAWMI